jgi:hypothetical protein
MSVDQQLECVGGEAPVKDRVVHRVGPESSMTVKSLGAWRSACRGRGGGRGSAS